MSLPASIYISLLPRVFNVTVILLMTTTTLFLVDFAFLLVNRPRPLVCLQIIVHGMDQFMYTMGSFLHIKGQKNVTFIWFMLRNLFPTLPSLATKTSFILLGLIQAQRVRKIPCMPELSVHYVCKLMYVVSVKHTPFSLLPMCVHNSAAHHQWRSSLLCC